MMYASLCRTLWRYTRDGIRRNVIEHALFAQPGERLRAQHASPHNGEYTIVPSDNER